MGASHTLFGKLCSKCHYNVTKVKDLHFVKLGSLLYYQISLREMYPPAIELPKQRKQIINAQPRHPDVLVLLHLTDLLHDTFDVGGGGLSLVLTCGGEGGVRRSVGLQESVRRLGVEDCGRQAKGGES